MIQLPYIIAGVVIILVIVIIFTGYKKAPPDTAFIISGLRKKIIIGKASVKLPFLERMDKLSLKLIAIDVKTSNAVPTADYINIQVDAAVNVKISSEPSRLAWQRRTADRIRYIASTRRSAERQHERDRGLHASGGDGQRPSEIRQSGKREGGTRPGCHGSCLVSFNVPRISPTSNGVIEDPGTGRPFPRLRKKLPLQRRRRKRKSPLPKRRQIARPMTQGLIQNVKLLKRTMSLHCRRPN